MASELIYTSAEKGLKSRSSGFCTVAMTAGLAGPVIDRLESLSGYSFPTIKGGGISASDLPINFTHYQFIVAGKACRVLSRVAPVAADYTGRSSKLAHHLVLGSDELHPAGPLWLARQPGTFVENWGGDPLLIPEPRTIQAPPRRLSIAKAWEQATGDAGWAGVVAEHSITKPAAVVAILYRPDPSIDLLALLDEALSLLPLEARWGITFSTYFTDPPVGTTCLWRCLLPDSPHWDKLRRRPDTLAIDLTAGLLGMAKGGSLVEAARTGVAPAVEPIGKVETVVTVVDHELKPSPTGEPAVPGIGAANTEAYALRETAVASSGSRPATPAINSEDRHQTHPRTRRKPPRAAMWLVVGLGAITILAVGYGILLISGPWAASNKRPDKKFLTERLKAKMTADMTTARQYAAQRQFPAASTKYKSVLKYVHDQPISDKELDDMVASAKLELKVADDQIKTLAKERGENKASEPILNTPKVDAEPKAKGLDESPPVSQGPGKPAESVKAAPSQGAKPKKTTSTKDSQEELPAAPAMQARSDAATPKLAEENKSNDRVVAAGSTAGVPGSAPSTKPDSDTPPVPAKVNLPNDDKMGKAANATIPTKGSPKEVASTATAPAKPSIPKSQIEIDGLSKEIDDELKTLIDRPKYGNLNVEMNRKLLSETLGTRIGSSSLTPEQKNTYSELKKKVDLLRNLLDSPKVSSPKN